MSNMSYCRFQNTNGDLRDCQDALEELFHGQGEPLSRDEIEAAKALVQRCMDIAMLIEEYTGEAYDDLDAAQRDVEPTLDDANAAAEKAMNDRAMRFDPHPANGRCRNCGCMRGEHDVDGACDDDEADEAGSEQVRA